MQNTNLPNISAKITWNNDVKLIELNKLSYVATLENENNANYIQWSADNELLVVNLMDQLVIFETNIYLVSERLKFINESIGSNLAFRSATIKPVKFQFKIPPPFIEDNFLDEPKALPRFIDFQFAPTDISKRYYLLACLTDANVLLIYANIIPLQWFIAFNVSKFFNEYNLTLFDNCKNYFDKLDQIRITAFTWSSKVIYQNEKKIKTYYYLYFGSRKGILYFSKLILNDNDEMSMEIVKNIEVNFKIITLKVFQNYLLVQNSNGQILLFSLDLNSQIIIWNKIDNSPSYNFSFRKLEENLFEIVFSKYKSIIFARITKDQCELQELFIPSSNEVSKIKNIFSVFNFGQHYCFTPLSNDIYIFQQLNNDQCTLSLRKLIISSHKNYDDVRFSCISTSSNHALVVIISSQYRFSGRLCNNKKENVILYFGTLYEQSTAVQFLSKYLLMDDFHYLADFLYLFRYNLLRNECLFEQLDTIIDVLLKKIPVWIVKNYERIRSTFIGFHRLKFIRHLTRYCLIECKKIEKNDEYNLLQKLYWKLNFLILENYFKRIFTIYIQLDNCDPSTWAELLTIEQLASLNNIIKSEMNIFSKETCKHIEQLTQNKSDQLEKFKSSRENYNQEKDFLSNFNCCPICSQKIDDPSQIYLNGDCKKNKHCIHQIDVDLNSLLIIDPIINSTEICRKCQESKLMDLKDNLWPNPMTLPFQIQSKTCIFCL